MKWHGIMYGPGGKDFGPYCEECIFDLKRLQNPFLIFEWGKEILPTSKCQICDKEYKENEAYQTRVE